MTKFLSYTLAFFIFLSFFSSNTHAQTEPTFIEAEGIVTEITESGKETVLDEWIEYQIFNLEISRGEKKGEVVSVEHSQVNAAVATQQYEPFEVGNHIKIVGQTDGEGNTQYVPNGKVKRTGLIALTLLFIITVVIVGRLWGALSLVGLGLSFVVIFKLIIPLIIEGTNPIIAAGLGSLLIIPTTFYISHGFNSKTHVGVVTTIIGLIITGFLATYFVDATYLTGFASEEAGFLQVERQGSIDIRGLLLAGIIIGTLGVLDDITIGQASTVKQLKSANPDLTQFELFKKAMHVGHDHIASLVNTLILVYAGSALPLLLLFFGSDKTFIDIIEFELIAEEIVRMLVGSIGIVLAAPLSTAIAAYVFSRKKLNP